MVVYFVLRPWIINDLIILYMSTSCTDMPWCSLANWFEVKASFLSEAKVLSALKTFSFNLLTPRVHVVLVYQCNWNPKSKYRFPNSCKSSNGDNFSYTFIPCLNILCWTYCHWYVVIDVNSYDKLLWWQHELVMNIYTVGISVRMANKVCSCVMKGQWCKENAAEQQG